MVLTAVGFALVLAYGAASASIARTGYAEMQLRQQIEEIRARTAFLRYQNDFAASSEPIKQTVARLGLVMGDPVEGVDYVSIPASSRASATRLALASPEDHGSLASAISEFAMGVGTAGRAEASTDTSHRR